MKAFLMLLAICGGLYATSSRAQETTGAEHPEASQSMQIPSSVQAEHQELRAELAAATRLGGETGDAARALEKELVPHFAEEEKYALPPLGLLGALSEGKATPEMRPAIALSEQLKARLPEMLAEHRAIEAAAKNLQSAARRENKPEAAAFAENLLLHAQNEEQVTYPSAIVAGEYLKLRLAEQAKR